MLAGTGASAFVLARATTTPPAGVGELKLMVPSTQVPPVTGLADRFNPVIAGFTVIRSKGLI